MRYERKYRIENLHLNVILQSVRLHPAGFRRIYPDRQINNIYFDTPDLLTYKENVMGIAKRNKYRVRWYGYDTHRVRKPQFEIKHRHNQVGAKTICKVEAFSLDNLSEITQKVNSLSNDFRYAHLSPTLLNSYVRTYFGSYNRKFRVTVDSHLRYHSWLTGSKFVGYRIEEKSVFILEIKYDRAADVDIDYVMQYFPFRQTKNSKYVNGLDLCLM